MAPDVHSLILLLQAAESCVADRDALLGALEGAANPLLRALASKYDLRAGIVRR